jgi:hypothetical protein
MRLGGEPRRQSMELMDQRSGKEKGDKDEEASDLPYFVGFMFEYQYFTIYQRRAGRFCYR